MYDFSEFVHALKESGYKGSGKRGDFTFQELDQLAQDFLSATDEDANGGK